MTTPQLTSGLALFGRLLWMMLGPMLLVLMTFSVVVRGGGWLTAGDVGFFVVLGLMLLGRWLEFSGGHPQTSTGEPATQADLWRYVLLAGSVGLAVWVVANIIGNHWLTR